MEEQAKEIAHQGLKVVCFQLFMVHIKQCRNICKKLSCTHDGTRFGTGGLCQGWECCCLRGLDNHILESYSFFDQKLLALFKYAFPSFLLSKELLLNQLFLRIWLRLQKVCDF